jgi:hypothetical protein
MSKVSYDHAVEMVNSEIGQYLCTKDEKKNVIFVGNKSDLSRSNKLNTVDNFYRMESYSHVETSAKFTSSQQSVINAILEYVLI